MKLLVLQQHPWPASHLSSVFYRVKPEVTAAKGSVCILAAARKNFFPLGLLNTLISEICELMVTGTNLYLKLSDTFKFLSDEFKGRHMLWGFILFLLYKCEKVTFQYKTVLCCISIYTCSLWKFSCSLLMQCSLKSSRLSTHLCFNLCFKLNSPFRIFTSHSDHYTIRRNCS